MPTVCVRLCLLFSQIYIHSARPVIYSLIHCPFIRSRIFSHSLHIIWNDNFIEHWEELDSLTRVLIVLNRFCLLFIEMPDCRYFDPVAALHLESINHPTSWLHRLLTAWFIGTVSRDLESRVFLEADVKARKGAETRTSVQSTVFRIRRNHN